MCLSTMGASTNSSSPSATGEAAAGRGQGPGREHPHGGRAAGPPAAWIWSDALSCCATAAARRITAADACGAMACMRRQQVIRARLRPAARSARDPRQRPRGAARRSISANHPDRAAQPAGAGRDWRPVYVDATCNSLRGERRPPGRCGVRPTHCCPVHSLATRAAAAGLPPRAALRRARACSRTPYLAGRYHSRARSPAPINWYQIPGLLGRLSRLVSIAPALQHAREVPVEPLVQRRFVGSPRSRQRDADGM
jgi:hypothetical protein